ncbi:MAG: zinc dependent phospholipase C family protein [Clostridia bacterium]|nr:zinc dependent phospholipase C family protein [Clostridia bacterium]
MPSSITHQLIAEEAAKQFPPTIQEAAEKHRDYFILGAQGPDALFFIKPLSKKEFNIGRHLHRYDVYETFRFFLSYLETLSEESRSKMTAYVAGYVCHYATDTVFHPFVYAYVKAHGKRGMLHQLIETDWDVYFARTHGGRAVGWKFPFSAKKLCREGELYFLYRALSEKLNRLPLKQKTFQKGIKNFTRYLWFFHRTSYAKFWARTERILHLEPKLSCLYPREKINRNFLESAEYFSLSGGQGNNADELFSLAVSKSARLCEEFFSGNLSPSEFNKSFLTAKEIK